MSNIVPENPRVDLIGAHNNVRIKVDLTQPEGNFCDTMLILFQLVITIFRMSAIYFPTKRLTEQHTHFSQVIVSSSLKYHATMCNICSRLLSRMENDVEENPGPTIII